MLIGVPREIQRQEHRVGLNPFAVTRLTHQGHTVLVETRAGAAAHFTDRDYGEAGGRIVYGAEEVYGRADLVCRVGMLTRDELEMLKPGSIVTGFHHLAVAPRDVVSGLIGRETSLVSYELIRTATGERPVMLPFSEMGGRMALQIAAHYLQVEEGGRGVLLGNVPGVPPPTVLILGAGNVGRTAARQALAMGAHVIVMDQDLPSLSRLSHELSHQVVTVMAADARLAQYTAIADVIIGAVLIPGERAPFLVTEKMVRSMKPGSVVVDLSIDQGGCIETSRPTTVDHPTFKVHDVIHFCVPNITTNIARTASRALVNAALPYVSRLASHGLTEAVRSDPALAEGTVLYRGRVTQPRIGQALDTASTPVSELIEREGSR